ncbi:hypothetical protein [Actibacterium sp. MT2.3-13A]|uniref:hypothetical protein n=1 Tax=Actibacterium sp. MT2.3-13A TaxID=2828332 RepID=UPI001BAE2679|nr:hypothetical protein [Actibacterium sp. MT2.3-13A]
MRANLCIILAFAGFPGTLRASDLPVAPLPAQAPAAAQALPPAFDLTRHDAAPFLERRAALQAAFAQAEGAAAAGAALLDMAEFYLAQALVPEGRSILSGLDGLPLAPAPAARGDAVALALDLLDPRGAPLRDADRARLDAGWEGWADRPLFLALDELRRGSPAEAAAHLDGALLRLDAYPAPFQAAVLPGLLEAAIEAGHWQMARDLAARFKDHAELRDGSAYHFLLGRAAHAGGELLAAFDSYALVAAGSDRWAQRARLALVRLGQETGTLTAAEARVLLAQARQIWRGDALAVETLQALTEAEIALGDSVAALEVLGELFSSYPDTPTAEAARTRAQGLLETYYARAAEGDIPLSDFMLGHRQISRDYRLAPGFDRLAEVFAERFLAAGASDVAAREYGMIHDYLAVARDLGLAEVAPERLDALRLKQAEALLTGGQHEAVAALLARGIDTDSTALRDRLNLLQARLFDATGAPERVLETQVTLPSEDYLRIKAEAHFAREDWTAAKAAYARLWHRQGDALRFGDAINLLLAAHRSGDRAQTLALAEAFPALTDIPQWAEIATSLMQEAPATLPLREEAARARVDDAGRTLDRLRAIQAVSN